MRKSIGLSRFGLGFLSLSGDVRIAILDLRFQQILGEELLWIGLVVERRILQLRLSVSSYLYRMNTMVN